MEAVQQNTRIINSVIQLAAYCANQGWVPATSGNFSTRESEAVLWITVSGKDKGNLSPEDLLAINAEGQPLEPEKKPSAETLLHTQLYRRFPEIHFVAHVHSVNSTALSKTLLENNIHEVSLQNLELLKALSGVKTHLHEEVVPIFENNQDIAALAIEIETYIQKNKQPNNFHGYLIAGHGFYTWGKDLEEVKRHCEAFDVLFETTIHEAKLTGAFK